MRTNSFGLLLILAVLACFAVAQTIPPSPAAALHILSPKSGEKIDNNIVTVRYELAAPASAASTPTFQLRLDSQDPVRTSDTQYTFTGLATGVHSVTVQVVDANGTPISGAQGQVQFTVAPVQDRGTPPSPRSLAVPAQASVPQLQPAAMTWQQPSQGAPSHPPTSKQGEEKPLPKTGSPLPLLSVIGMGVLLGGIASALRTRHSGNRSH